MRSLYTPTVAEIKRCNKCTQEKDVSEFNKGSTRKDGLQTYCRTCSAAYYANNRELRIVQAAKVAARRRLEMQEWIADYLRSHPCVDCGESDSVVLEFDHVRGVKVAGVSEMVMNSRPPSVIEGEIAKCDVRCANCHRRRTAAAGGWKKTIR